MSVAARLPGTSGHYFSTPDVNLLDADTAHLQQSVGSYAIVSGASGLAQSTDMTPVFGDYHGEAVCNGSGALSMFVPTTTFAVSPSTEYTYRVAVSSSVADREAQLAVNWYTSVPGLISASLGTVTALTVGAWTVLSVTATSPGTAAYARIGFQAFRQVDDSAPVSGDKMYWDAVALRTGSDATFVPSLRIVGDLDMGARLSAKWVSSTDATEVLIGRDDSAGTRAYAMYLRPTTTVVRARLVDDAATAFNVDANISGSWPTADDVVIDLQGTFDLSTGVWQIYVDNVAAGSGSTTARTGLLAGDSELSVAYSSGAAAPLEGDVYWTEVRDGIDGPVVARFDAADVPT